MSNVARGLSIPTFVVDWVKLIAKSRALAGRRREAWQMVLGPWGTGRLRCRWGCHGGMEGAGKVY